MSNNKSKLKIPLLIVSALSVLLIALYSWQLIETRHLNSEIDRYTKEIEFLESKNEVLKKENQSFQDIMWHENNQKMKELGE